MKNYTYNFEIKNLLTQFTAAFDDTVIKRYDKNGVARQHVEVRYVFAPKQRIMYDIVNKAQNLTLPVVSIDLASISYDNDRVFNKLNNFENYQSSNTGTAIRTPVPVNLQVNMSIMCRYMQDMEQIVSNFVPYTNPYIVLAWEEPTSLSGAPVEIRTEVLWDQNITLNNPTETTYSEKFRVVGDTSFTIKGWLFRNKNEISSPIYFIEQNFVNVDSRFNFQQPLSSLDYDNFFTNLSGIAETETINLSGIPELTNIYFNASGSNVIETNGNPVTIAKTASALEAYSYTFLGGNYNETEFVMLSSNDTSLFTSFTGISTLYTGLLSGFILPNSAWNVITNDVMNITFPYLSGSNSRFDLIIKNPAGFTTAANSSGFYFISY